MLLLADVLLYAAHVAVIGFNVLGWIWKPTRKANLALLGITLGSWLLMAAWKGAGYCFLTDWEWSIRARRGITDDPDNFVALLIRNVIGWNAPDSFTRALALWVFVFCLAMSLALNLRDWQASKRNNLA